MSSDALWQVLDLEKVQKRARRCETPGLFDDSPGPFDKVARIVFDGRVDGSDESRFLELMTGYLGNCGSVTRWERLAAASHAFAKDFKAFVKYLDDKGLPTRPRRDPSTRR